ncbi:hypothetical protein Hanom_Chr05g00459931 [Helianthus anomalus]
MPSLSSSTSTPEKQNTKQNKKKYSHLYFIFPFILCNTNRISAYAISQPRSRRLFNSVRHLDGQSLKKIIF